MKTGSIAIVCATLLLIGVLFWPTLYRYDMAVGENSFQVRSNRLTGYTEYFLRGEWIPEKRRQRYQETKAFPSAEQAMVTGNAGLTGLGSFRGKIHNGSSQWTITDMVFRVIAKERDGSVRWNRMFRHEILISPLQTRDFTITVTGDEYVSSSEWSIEVIRGQKGKDLGE